MDFKKNTIEFISANIPEPLLQIMCFLDEGSLLEYALSSQLIFGEVSRLVKTRKVELHKRRILDKTNTDAKPKMLQNYMHIRQSLFDSAGPSKKTRNGQNTQSSSSILDEKWLYVPNPSKEIPMIEETVSKKLLAECCVFMNRESSGEKGKPSEEFLPNLLLTHRCLVDDRLAYRFGSSSKSDQEFDNSKYEMFYSSGSSSLNMVGVDVNDKSSLLSRQKEALRMIKERENQEEEKVSSTIQPPFKLKDLKKICIILCHGGYFSAVIYNEGKPVIHKSDHKYVVRKKAGGRQATKDKSANIKSMGSQIRRANEKKHQENVKGILSSLMEDLKKCQLILLYAPGFNEQILMGDDEDVLIKLSETIPIRSICLSAKRANFTENERLLKTLAKIHLFMPSGPAIPSH